MYYYNIAPVKIIKNDQSLFTYQSKNRLAIGSIVMVSIGKKELIGVIFSESKKPTFKTKDIIKVVEESPLPKHLLSLSLWMSSYYVTPLATVLQTVLPSGLAKKRRERSQHESIISLFSRTKLLLNEHQLKALARIDNSPASTILLHGITGSGKTNVYIKLILETLKSGCSAIILLPEISLTSQITTQLNKYIANKKIIIHSKQTPAERHLSWRDALISDEPIVVVGPRSALFAPVKKLGLIIVDEAHEPTLKQDQSPKYDALRAASFIAKDSNIKTILCTATPLLLDNYLASSNDALVKIDQKATKTTRSSISIIDIKSRQLFKKHRFLSDKVIQSVSRNIEQGSQTLFFHNRRGSANLVVCESCGWQALCDQCLLPLTFHQNKHVLMCHSCGSTHKFLTRCPTCNGTSIIHKGIGTQALESEISKLWPKASIVRLDSDSDDNLEDNLVYKKILEGKTKIIIGTQSVAKGLDLPNLRTVVVTQADLGLSLPDFSSEERTFQLLSQVVGRVGRRNSESEAIIQTYQPDNPVIKLGVEQNYSEFYNYCIEKRRVSNFPPFSFLLKLTCTYKNEENCIKQSSSLTGKIRQRYKNITVSSPMPAFHERSRNGFRWQLIIKSRSRQTLVRIISELPNSPHWQYDIDPHNLL